MIPLSSCCCTHWPCPQRKNTLVCALSRMFVHSPWTALGKEFVWLVGQIAFVRWTAAGVMRQLTCLPAATVGEPINLQYEHVVSLSALPGVSGPLASHLVFLPKAMAACLLVLTCSSRRPIWSPSLINWENQSRRGGNCLWTSHNLLCDRLC